MQEPTFTVEIITPEQARQYLDGHANFRHLRQRKVDSYAADMRLGRWDFNAHAIEFDADGNLVDGQHRLAAVVATGIPLRTLVARGMNPEATRDVGLPRTVGDELERRGIGNWNSKAAAARLVIAYQRGHLHDYRVRSELTNSLIRDFATENDEALAEATRAGARVRRAFGASAACYSAFYFVASELDAEEASRFTSMLVDGSGLSVDDPILALRNWCVGRIANRQKVTHEEWLFAFTKAWSAWRQGEPMRLMKVVISGRGSSRTPFPVLV